MFTECSRCHLSIKARAKVIQISIGVNYDGAITPSRYRASYVRAEGHVSCFNDYLTKPPQHQPYQCTICEVDIPHNDKVIYAVIGDKPSPSYFRAERRGDELPFIAHLLCWEAYMKL